MAFRGPARYHDHRCRRPRPLPQVTSHLPDAPTAPGLLSPFTRHPPSPTHATEAAPRFPGLAPAADPRGRSRSSAAEARWAACRPPPEAPRGVCATSSPARAELARAPQVCKEQRAHARGAARCPRRLRDLRLLRFPREEGNETAESGGGIRRPAASPGGFRSAQTPRGPHTPPSQTPAHAGAWACLPSQKLRGGAAPRGFSPPSPG